MVNINGMKDMTVMERLKQLMCDEKMEVLFVTEAHLSREKQKTLEKVFSGWDVFVRGRKKKKNKQYHQRGGVVCIAEKGVVSAEKECVCDDILCVKWRGLCVVCAYFVPATSPFQKRNQKRMVELQQRVLEYGAQRTLVLTDANAWIGEEPSVIDRGLEHEERVYPRSSVKPESNTQGEWFLSSMNSVNLVVLNGLKSIAEHTFDHPGRDAKSVVDFIAGGCEMLERMSDVFYTDCREGLCTDHVLIGVEVWGWKKRLEQRSKNRKGLWSSSKQSQGATRFGKL